ncbi:hypothetical protein VOLCADRAFT_92153 [Volvox carteri f. nagariensis]|uniref:Uncharacterized protein n=1 Tax=Volvox carteri f. nagariensis TaxID=3068 RepID=D8TYR5_VOLCA|nr:uncharacterized protein VOLCADRAFT_92153 [Volvox carteri f. nagariensis]EFJ47359.1 hypothetical protein VOLCADRAFT_92153 [Volvox carteri f. nagariensis]|eukprot:XP_002951548.1 hypothetical protein VOLCADRAFT_92153 [Volvox carteri f. nagariensis]
MLSVRWSAAPQKAGGASSEAACWSACTSQSARSTASGLIQSLLSAPLTEVQRKQSDDAASKLLRTVQLRCTDSQVGRELPSTQAHEGAEAFPKGNAILGQISCTDLEAAAALLPSLTWQWLSVADLDGWVDRGVAHLLREALLVQRASSDTSASINELVGWCLDNCSRPAVALAAVWGAQQGQTLSPRCRSFYGLMLQRLGISEASQQQQLRMQPQLQPQPAVVFCSSVTRTALSTASSRRRSSSPSSSSSSPEGLEYKSEANDDDVGALEEGFSAGGSNGNCNIATGSGNSSTSSSSRSGARGAATGTDLDLDPNPDLVILGELPEEAQSLLLQQSEAETAVGIVQAPLQQQSQWQGRPPAGRANGRRNSSSVAGHANGSSVSRWETEARPVVGGSGNSSAPDVGDASARASGQDTDTPATPAVEGLDALLKLGLQQYDGTVTEYLAGPDVAPGDSVSASEASGATAGAVIRPTASLLQRPSRNPITEPELEPGAERASEISGTASPGAAISGSSSSSMGGGGGPASPGWHFRSSAAGPQQSYIAVHLVAIGEFPLRDLSGAVLKGGLAVPESGPIVISNDPRVFPGTEAVLSDYVTAAGDKLAMRLEYVVDRSSYNEVSLQLFNISRITRKRTENCLMYVNGKPLNVGDPGVALMPGDEVWFGHRAFCFRVEALQGTPSAVQEALQRLCDDDTMAAAAVGAANVSEPANVNAANAAALVRADAAGFPTDSGEASSDELPYTISSTSSTTPDMAELSNLSRRDPVRAEAALRRLAASNPGDAAVWLIWAQTAARMERPAWQAKARLLFRAAVDAARRMEIIPPPPAALQAVAQRAVARGRGRRIASLGATVAPAAGAVMAVDDGAADAYGTGTAAAALPPQATAATTSASATRHNWLLVQALGNWGKHEWRLRMYGSARHLFRAAVDEAARHPDGVGGGGGAAILHFWASRELDAMNVRNARIVAAEALRKCPADVALYVLAAGVELEGGNLELAKSYCQRAYALDRTDKQLFLVWPRVEAALGDRLKARLLYERALDMYPLNTKILNLYARFEAEEGSYREAAELYDRALRIDPLSPVMGVHNRADWASLEADLGNISLARALLEGGLEAHPRSTPLLVTLAKVERLEGRYSEALRLVRAAQAIAGPFNAAVMTERSQVLRAMGEREMAANLARHVAAVKELTRMKQQGYWGSEAWRAFIEATRSSEQKALVAAARARKQQLGWAPTVRGAKPQPTGQAGDGRRPAAPEAQQWLQLEQLRLRRTEARRLAAQRAARIRSLEDGGAAAGASAAAGAGAGGVTMASRSSGDDEYDDYYYDEQPVGVPSLDSVRRPTPGDEDMYDT